ncbi:propionyl-CoA carboxylase [Nitratireductor indicus C115]|uniref:Propionyl-CoA carboxylase n=1 Tax=Nitratireductor indicus C115 TaxID=1231190 RepID=K2NZA3_9HYPH|nr:carboxyl transferase domain-containing protein [Nitratireductor indicus]EKF43234.1 propionyl-CoA carboxylase [Nitratireductor indicus C115]SFQ53932.1 Acetyl-CoA carboxylase, carboxyltransferase component [Nitratireductor indicus]
MSVMDTNPAGHCLERSDLEELEFRRSEALKQGGEAAVDRQHTAGRLTVRERIDRLADMGSFHELAQLTGAGHYDDNETLTGVTPAPYVCGTVAIDGRTIAVGGEDFTVRGGTTFSAPRRKGGQGGLVEDFAFHYRVPLVNLIDGAGGSVASIEKRRHAVLPGVHGFERSVSLLGRSPVVSAVLGTAAGGPAGRAILSHFSIMVRGKSQIFAAGPPVVRRSLGQDIDKEELGGAHVAVDMAGTIHNAADSEEGAFEQIRRFLSFMPQNVWELPPVTGCDDPVDRCEDALASLVPKNRRQAFDMRRLVRMIADRDSGFEIQPTHGKAVHTILARFGGRPTGIVANNPMFYGGAIDHKAARKQIRFMQLCDTFRIPLIFLVDVPGFMVGRHAEEHATLLEGMRVVHAAAQLTVPTTTLVIRKCYGMAGMATCNKNGVDYKMAWPSAEWGSLPIEGGVAAAFRREIAAAEDPGAKEQEIEARLRPLASPFRSAEAFAIEEIIDPRETRPILCRLVELAGTSLGHDLGPKGTFNFTP